MMSFFLVNVAWDIGMNEAPLWHMDCKFSIEYVMPHSALTAGHAKGQLTMLWCNSTTSLECLLSSQCPRGTTANFQLAWTIGAFIAC